MNRENCKATARRLGVKAAERLMRGECEPATDTVDTLPPLDLLAEHFGYVQHAEISGDLILAFEEAAAGWIRAVRS